MKNKSRLHRVSVAASLAAICIGVTACGGEVVGRNSNSIEVVSGASVSGSGISQKKDKSSESMNDTKRLIAAIYPHTNSRFLYREKEGKIEQRDLEGKVIQSFSVPGLDTGGTYDEDEAGFEIEWVSDREILYNLYRERESEDSVPELWCVPLKDTKEGEVLDMAGAEKLFEDSAYDICVEYADSQCILYSTLEPSYCKEYDRRKKKKVPLDSSRPKARWYPRSVNGDVSKFIVHSFEKSKEEYPTGVYVHEAGSGKVEKINECYGSKWSQLHGTVSDKRFLYTELLQEPQVIGKVSYDIWCYDGETGKNQILLPEKEWRELAGDMEFQELWADGDRLYIEVFEEKKDGDHTAVFSCSLSDGKGLRWEEELNRYLHSYDDVYMIGIEAGRCFYEAGDYDGDGVAVIEDRYCYRFSSGENKKIEKSDAENWLWHWYCEDEE